MEPPVECQICQNQPNAYLPFYCSGCARAQLYKPRLENAQTLLMKESISRNVTEVSSTAEEEVQDTNSGNSTTVLRLSASYQLLRSDVTSAQAREAEAQRQCSSLRADLNLMKNDIASKKNALAQQRSAQLSAKSDVEHQQNTLYETIKVNTKQAEMNCRAIQNRTTDVRVFLCKEVASLYGLTHKLYGKVEHKQDQYLLGQVPIVDLRDLNAANPTQVTVSIGRIAHFVYLTSHYLSVRLPAEIILPSPSEPYASIFTPLSSYKYPTLPTGTKNTNVPIASSRQRFLNMEKSLPELASEDAIKYSLFIDAITLLAWDIAWMGRSQGLDVGSARWEDICVMGKTLYTLFGSNRETGLDDQNSIGASNSLADDPAAGDAANLDKAATEPSNTKQAKTPFTLSSPGFLSHGSSRGYLPASAQLGGGADMMQSWQFSSPLRLIEKVKSALASERAGAEWELLDKETETILPEQANKVR